MPVAARGVATNVFSVEPVILVPVPVRRAPGAEMVSSLGFKLGLYPAETPEVPPVAVSGTLVVVPVNVAFFSLLCLCLFSSSWVLCPSLPFYFILCDTMSTFLCESECPIPYSKTGTVPTLVMVFFPFVSMGSGSSAFFVELSVLRATASLLSIFLVCAAGSSPPVLPAVSPSQGYS